MMKHIRFRVGPYRRCTLRHDVQRVHGKTAPLSIMA